MEEELILEVDGYKLYSLKGGEKFYLAFQSGEGMSLRKDILATYFQKIYNDLF